MKRPNKKDYIPKTDDYFEYIMDLEKYADYAEDVLEAREDKEFTIRVIEKRIKDESRKYGIIDGYELVTAIKIYNMLFPNNNDSKTTVEILQLTPDQAEDYLKNI